jgi:hypothetical protein
VIWKLEIGANFGRSHDAVIRVHNGNGNVIETHQHKGDFMEWVRQFRSPECPGLH